MSENFLDGYLCACQFIAIDMGQDTMAEYAMRESGYSLEEILRSQKKSGYHTRKMNKIIRNAVGE